MRLFPQRHTIVSLCLGLVGAISQASFAVDSPTAASLQGTYAGVEDGTTAVCNVQIKIADRGLFFTPYLEVQIENSSFYVKAAETDAALAAMGTNDAVTLTSHVESGLFAENDSTLQLFFTNGAVTGLHYQQASFSGGWIQGPWNVIDCNDLH